MQNVVLYIKVLNNVMNLHELVKTVLGIERTGLTKVRLAKTLYFVHKELVRDDLSTIDDIRFVRMPLGPVPVGFMTLNADCSDIIVTKINNAGLLYNSELYSVKQRIKWLKKDTHTTKAASSIDRTLQKLRHLKTSELVELSHEEPSWKKFKNGEEYVIEPTDLNNVLPIAQRSPRLDSDDNLLQASLVRGMLDDIVQESTDLEYPDAS